MERLNLGSPPYSKPFDHWNSVSSVQWDLLCADEVVKHHLPASPRRLCCRCNTRWHPSRVLGVGSPTWSARRQRWTLTRGMLLSALLLRNLSSFVLVRGQRFKQGRDAMFRVRKWFLRFGFRDSINGLMTGLQLAVRTVETLRMSFFPFGVITRRRCRVRSWFLSPWSKVDFSRWSDGEIRTYARIRYSFICNVDVVCTRRNDLQINMA